MAQPNDAPSETVTEDFSLHSRRPTRSSILVDADVITDEHYNNNSDKQLLTSNSSSSLADNIISPGNEVESHNYDDAQSSLNRNDCRSSVAAVSNDGSDEGKPAKNESCPPSAVSPELDLSKPQQKHLFRTSHCGIEVFVYTGDLLWEKVGAIVNPANVYLVHSGGAAKAIAVAAGWQLQNECEQYIKQEGPLNVTQVVHTSAGNLQPNILHVIHAASCSAGAYQDQSKLCADLQTTFYNCLRCANDVLKVKSISIPAIGAGWYRV